MFTWYIYAIAPDKVVLIDRSSEKFSSLKQCIIEMKTRMKVHHYPDGYEVKALIFTQDEHLYMQITDTNPFTNSLVECTHCHRIA